MGPAPGRAAPGRAAPGGPGRPRQGAPGCRWGGGGPARSRASRAPPARRHVPRAHLPQAAGSGPAWRRRFAGQGTGPPRRAPPAATGVRSRRGPSRRPPPGWGRWARLSPDVSSCGRAGWWRRYAAVGRVFYCNVSALPECSSTSLRFPFKIIQLINRKFQEVKKTSKTRDNSFSRYFCQKVKAEPQLQFPDNVLLANIPVWRM
ncbi:eukaryotic translation initiation factor 3 subunit A-like isoform X1 [Falco biarmicus]|uniref:eukaryotic translation initiation factor 3 subunit A-like isoform X1 n=1 Tax=Falco biarmicus TaxID=345155 RepID=UPI0024BCF1E1|nr:eukaryotic translation initiation factor 3 subunit A-like isoform X1 [Falco biarmicus]